MPIPHPHWVATRDRAGDLVVWVWRWVLRFSDWVDRNLGLILTAIVALTLVMGVTLVLAHNDLRQLALGVFMVGVVGVTAVVAYKAGARTR